MAEKIMKDVGIATAYGYALAGGYTGSEEEFTQLMADYAEVGQDARQSAENAEAWAVGQRNGTDVTDTDETYHNNAKYYAEQASGSASSASASAFTATSKASEASTSAGTATSKAEEASTSAMVATTKASEALESAGDANGFASSALEYSTTASSAASIATNKADEAYASASSASTYASNAASSASDAEAFASTATTKASEASTSASNASASASTASTKASEASTSATTASNKATEASGYASNAAASATAASGSASSASASATTASTAASTATTKANEASASASSASTSASGASTSATSAATSASTATTKASEASTSAASAAASASSAASAAQTAVDTAVAELQAELDEAISGVTVDSEVINARVDAEGTTYGTLKQRLDAENTELKNHLNDTIDSVFKDRTFAWSTSIDIDAGETVNPNNRILTFDIPANTEYSYSVTFGAGISSITGLYRIDVNNTRTVQKYSPVSGRVYTDTSETALAAFSLYIEGANVTAETTVTINVSYVKTNNDSLESQLNEISTTVQNGIGESELINGANVVYRERQIEVGAEDSPSAPTYIFKNIITNRPVNGSVSIKVDNIENAVSRNPVVVYFYNSSNSVVKEYDLSVAKVQRGITIYPTSDSVTYTVRLYPSTTGGLTTVKAIYTNIVIVESPWAFYYFNWFTKNDAQLPYYYMLNDYLPNKIATIRSKMKLSGGNYDAFVFCTDQHWFHNAKRSPALIRYICDELNIKRLFMGGDNADGINVDEIDAFKKAFNGNIYNVVGNHDYMDKFERDGVSTEQTVDDADLWMYLNSGMTDAVVGSQERNYYYVDNPVQKMRYIVLNVFADNGTSAMDMFETEQKQWFQNTALDLPSGYTAVIFAHSFYMATYNTDTITKTSKTPEIEDIVDAYNGDGEIACLVSGHSHVDGMTTTPGGIPAFITTTDEYMPQTPGTEPALDDRILGTITEQAFDVVVIDKKNKDIYFVRIGAPADNGTGTKLEIREQSYGT